MLWALARIALRLCQARPQRLSGGHPDRVFRAKGFADFVPRLQVGATDQVNAVRHRSKDARHDLRAIGALETFQRLGDRLGLAGQVDDEAPVADDRLLPRAVPQ